MGTEEGRRPTPAMMPRRRPEIPPAQRAPARAAFRVAADIAQRGAKGAIVWPDTGVLLGLGTDQAMLARFRQHYRGRIRLTTLVCRELHFISEQPTTDASDEDYNRIIAAAAAVRALLIGEGALPATSLSEEDLPADRHRPWHAPPEALAPALHQGLRRPGRTPGDARGGHEPSAPPHRRGEHLQAGVPAPEGGASSRTRRLKWGPIRPRGSPFPTPESIVASVEAAGFKKLRIACLWYRDETRLRMLDTFCKTFVLAPEGLDPRDGEELSLHGEQITAVFHYAVGFLKPGPSGNRTEALAASGASLRSQDGVLVGAWCETEIPTASDDGDDSQTSPDDLDAKPQTKTILAGLDVPTQYLRGKDDNGAIKPKTKDHPAEMALLDLYRSLGIIDDRIANALQPEKAGYPVDRIAHVGIYVRQQNRRKGESGQPKVVITASALVPPEVAGGTWTMLGWSSTRPGWRPYRLAQTAFHASAYPEGTGDKKTYRQRWDDAAETVERALADLAEELEETPYVVTVDEQSSRRMWDGLQNIRLGDSPGNRKSRYWLPGSTLSPDERPRAIIRINTEDEEVPQPVSTTHIAKVKDSEPVEKDTATTLYRITTDFGTPAWIFCNVPRAYDGASSGRLGSKYTRWDAKTLRCLRQERGTPQGRDAPELVCHDGQRDLPARVRRRRPGGGARHHHGEALSPDPVLGRPLPLPRPPARRRADGPRPPAIPAHGGPRGEAHRGARRGLNYLKL